MKFESKHPSKLVGMPPNGSPVQNRALVHDDVLIFERGQRCVLDNANHIPLLTTAVFISGKALTEWENLGLKRTRLLGQGLGSAFILLDIETS